MKTNLFILIAFAASSIYAQLKPVAYTDGTQKLSGLLGTPKNNSKKKAAVLILPAWMGIDENSKSSAERLSALGYYTFVADIYGEGNYPAGDPKKAREMSGYYKDHIDNYRKRIQLALEELVKSGADANNIVVIGYCFGGTGALEAARANMHVKGVVSFHGGLARDTTKAISSISPKVLVCHGASDRFIPDTQIKAFQNEMNESKADWQMVYYAYAVHAFTEVAAGNDPSKGVAYNEKAARRSWAHLLDFLGETLEL